MVVKKYYHFDGLGSVAAISNIDVEIEENHGRTNK